MRLYQMTDAIRAVLERAGENDTGELSELDEAELGRLDANWEQCAEFIAMKHREHLADAAAYRAEADLLAKAAGAANNRAESLKRYLYEQMQERGMTKFKGKILGARIQANPLRVDVFDAALIPAQYMIPQAPRMDSTAVLNAMKSGAVVPGAKIAVGSHLRIVIGGK